MITGSVPSALSMRSLYCAGSSRRIDSHGPFVNAQHVHQSNRIIDIGARIGVFAPLHAMLLRGELNGPND